MVSWFMMNSEECFDLGWDFCIMYDSRVTEDSIASRIVKF
jgi:hypothetical protein